MERTIKKLSQTGKWLWNCVAHINTMAAVNLIPDIHIRNDNSWYAKTKSSKNISGNLYFKISTIYSKHDTRRTNNLTGHGSWCIGDSFPKGKISVGILVTCKFSLMNI